MCKFATEAAFALARHGLNLLSNRPHSTFQISQKLGKLCYTRKLRAGRKKSRLDGGWCDIACDTVVQDAVQVIQDAGVLDDAAYARWHVEQRMAGPKVRSSLQLCSELFQAGIAYPIIQDVLATSYDERAMLSKAVAKLQRSSTDPHTAVFKLQKLGFDPLQASRVIQAEWSRS